MRIDDVNQVVIIGVNMRDYVATSFRDEVANDKGIRLRLFTSH
ncbi:hypothetical protein [Bradyrhizobium sp. USDA 10063]